MPQPTPPDLLLRGSLITLRRKCGKPSCHCAKGAAHETPALSWSVRGTTRMLTLRRDQLPEVRRALRRYRRARAQLDRRALAGIARLRRHRRQESRRSQQR